MNNTIINYLKVFFFFFVFTHILITIIITVYVNIYVLKVLKNSLIWLNDWEINLANYLINRGSVFNKNTTEGFRIKSSIDLINQLHNCGFDYVLISKIIQDCIEVNLTNICILVYLLIV